MHTAPSKPTAEAKPKLVVFAKGATAESAIQLWPEPDSLPVGTLREAREYLFELRDVRNPDNAELFIDDRPAEALRSPSPTTARWKWSPGFYAGRIEIRIDLPSGERVETSAITDPDLHKLTRDDFDTMVRDILEDTFALFSLSGFRTGIARGTGKHVPPIAQLEFLRSRIESLEQTVREIAAHPVRVLHPEEETRPAARASGISASELQRSFRTGQLGKLPASSSFSETTRGLFPLTVRKIRKVALLDIPEHRAIKGAISSWRSWLTGIASLLATDDPRPDDVVRSRELWAKRCRTLAVRLGRLLEGELFEDVGEPIFLLVATSVFRNVVPYVRFYRLHHDMSLGIAAVQGEFLEMPLARTFDLYELWAFLRLLRAAIDRYSLPDIDVSELFSKAEGERGIAFIRNAAVVKLGPRLSLAFKRSFREYWTATNLCGTFTREMVPDVSLSTHTTETDSDRPIEKVLVLDAKYRIDEQLNDAVGSLHIYRDAIVQETEPPALRRAVVGAYLLTPFLPDVQGGWKEEPMPGRLFHPDYRTSFRFGALTLRPGMSLSQIADSLGLVIADDGIDPSEIR